MTQRERTIDPTASGEHLRAARRVVIKIGSTLLVDADSGKLNRPWLEALTEDIARLRTRGQDVILVSSGAIALGRGQLGLSGANLKLEESQAAAAAGQIRLAHAYQDALESRGLHVAQILVTFGDTEERRRYLNARNTMQTLIGLGAVPVVNENDTVATTEIRYGDNDRLAARVAQMASADCLVLLSDIDGLYTADPKLDPEARLIEQVTDITPAIEAMAGESASHHGSGGMVTKIAAARIAMAAGCQVVIANGHGLRPLEAIEAGASCTWFVPQYSPLKARKQWIAGSLRPRGELTVDGGAAAALQRGNSLLPAGVTEVSGEFQRGDAVVVRSDTGAVLGHGLCAYSSADARRIMGCHSGEIAGLLGYEGRDEIIHRDDLVVFRS